MVKVIKKLNKISKIKFSKNVNFVGEDFNIDLQISVKSCHPDDAIINGVNLVPFVKEDDYLTINGEKMFYTPKEIDEILYSSEFKNLILKEITKKALLS